MTNETEQQKLRVLKDYQNGRIKVLGNGCYSVPNEYFILGITPRLVNKIIKNIKFDLENKGVKQK